MGHNIIAFDLDVLESFLGFVPADPSIIVDTLVLSRLLDYNRPGGHSLEAWGERFQVKKSEWNNFDEWSQELEDRCIGDTDINCRLCNYFSRHLESERWSRSIRLEHDLAFLCVGLNKTGFYFDLASCKELKENLYNIVEESESNFGVHFPPLVVPIREITPKETLKGTLALKDFMWMKGDKDLSPYSPNSSFTLFDYQPFNPASPSQIVHRLNLAGWKPVNKTKGHIEAIRNKEDLTEWKVKGWKVDEENLETLPDTTNIELWRDKRHIKIPKIKNFITNNTELKMPSKSDGICTTTLEAISSSNTQETITIPINLNLEIKNLESVTEYLWQIVKDYSVNKEDFVKYVNEQFHLSSIIVTQEGMFVDFSATNVTLFWDGTKDTQATQKITLIATAKKLAEYLLMKSRLSDLEEWEALCIPSNVPGKGTIHGTYNPIGSWTHRMSHTNPNTANIPALVNRKGKPQYLGREMRSMFLASSSLDHNGVLRNRLLVGVDADAIQLRVFAHLVNDPVLIKALVEGRKEDGTDAHSINKRIIERTIPCEGREVAKTYLYALFLGAGTAKQSEILSCSPAEAKQVQRSFMEAYPGWKELRESRIPKDAKRGYFEGLDGRLVKCESEHLMLAGYLQNGEKVVMGRAAVAVPKRLRDIREMFDLVNFVHDELQYDSDVDYVQLVGNTAMEMIVKQGEELNLNCPLAANMKVGNNWAETH